MAFIYQYYWATPEYQRCGLNLRWLAVPFGHLPRFQIQIRGEPS